jgi:hypothetical protein
VFKRAHKVIAVEINSSNIITVTDPVGKNPRQELNWASLSGAQQAKLDGRAKNRLGQT